MRAAGLKGNDVHQKRSVILPTTMNEVARWVVWHNGPAGIDIVNARAPDIAMNQKQNGNC